MDLPLSLFTVGLDWQPLKTLNLPPLPGLQVAGQESLEIKIHESELSESLKENPQLRNYLSPRLQRVKTKDDS